MSRKPGLLGESERGLLADEKGGLGQGIRNAGRSAVNWLTPKPLVWLERLVNAGLDMGAAFYGSPVGVPGDLTFVDPNTGRFTSPGYDAPLSGMQNPFAGFFNRPGDPVPAWMQPGAQFTNAPWMPDYTGSGWVDGSGNPTTPRYSWESDYGGSVDRPYGEGQGVFPLPPPPPRRSGMSAGSRVVAQGDAARAIVEGMRSPVVQQQMTAAQAREAMNRMFGGSIR